MDNNDFRILKILEELESDQTPSQRKLAGELNISLGLVNSFIKRLVRKGYFKVTNLPANRIKYILTPKGAAEKARLTYEYIQSSIEYYRSTRERLNVLFHSLESQGLNRILFWGVNELAEIAYISLQGRPIRLVGVVDEMNAGKRFLDHQVVHPVDVAKLEFDSVLVTDISSERDIEGELENYGVSLQKVTAQKLPFVLLS